MRIGPGMVGPSNKTKKNNYHTLPLKEKVKIEPIRRCKTLKINDIAHFRKRGKGKEIADRKDREEPEILLGDQGYLPSETNLLYKDEVEEKTEKKM